MIHFLKISNSCYLISLLVPSHGVRGLITIPSNIVECRHNRLHPLFSNDNRLQPSDVMDLNDQRLTTKNDLLDAIGSTPSNEPTSQAKTKEIMQLARDLESQCPTPEADVLENLSGSWELLWTAQDRSQKDPKQLGPFRDFINPLENQSYSNNPNGVGRANPFLPLGIQQKLEDMGIVGQHAPSSSSSDPVRSSQNIDLKRQKVRNVVSFSVPFLASSSQSRQPKASLTVTIDFKPNFEDKRKIDVKFQECRLFLPNTPIDAVIPLGIIGPTGWLRTGYIDDSIRITRGHKGSVFVLARPNKKKSLR